MPRSSSTIMRNRVMLQRRILTRNGFGEEIISWEDITPLNCSYEPLKGREFFQGMTFFGSYGYEPEKQSELDARIRIRFRKGISPAENRIVYGGIAHDIMAVIQDRERGETQLMVKATALEQSRGVDVNV